MFLELSRQMSKARLTWKPSSLELLQFGRQWDPVESLFWTVCGSTYKVSCRDAVDILGYRLNFVADPLVAAQHRVSQAWLHFWARGAFCDPRISLKTRYARYRQTVGRTLLYGSGAWGYSEAAVGVVSSAVRAMFQRMLRMHRHFDEPVPDFHQRLQNTTNHLLAEFLDVPISAEIARHNCGWLGHVARAPVDSLLWQVAFWRGTEWICISDAGDSLIPRRHVVGRPRARCDSRVVQAFGPYWRSLAYHRILWGEAIKTFVQGALEPHVQADCHLVKCGLRIPLLHAKSLHPITFVDFISNRHRDMLGSSRLTVTTRLLVLCCNPLVINMVKGVTKPWLSVVSHVRYVRWLIYLFELRWGCVQWPGFTEFIKERDRRFGLMQGALRSDNLLKREVLVESDLSRVREAWFVLSTESVLNVETTGSYVGAFLQEFTSDDASARGFICDSRECTDRCEADFEALVLGLRMFVKFLYRSKVAVSGSPVLHEYFEALPLV